MESITKYYKRLRATFLLTAFCIIAAAVLFVPSFGRYVRGENNVADILLNGTLVGCTDEPEKAEELLQSAREELVRDSGELVFMTADMELQGRRMVVGRVDSEDAIRKNMEEVLSSSTCKILQHAYTVKINEYMVNLKTSQEVLALLHACLEKYDPTGEYAVELVVDPMRELNVLTTSICRKEELKDPDEVDTAAGIALFMDEICEAAAPGIVGDFDTLDYGLKKLSYADTVEVVEAYLMEDEITSLNDAIDQVTKEQEKEQIYEVQPGNTLSQIALDNGLTVDGLVAINPSLESAESTIRVGDELIITVPEPELSVIHEELVYAEESYDAPVQYVDVDDWYTTKQEVVQEPSAGHRRVASVITYKNAEELGEEIILEEVDYEAVPKIVKRGTKVPPTYIKPISGGRLSSNFGGRSAPTKGASTYHQGIDWATPVGTAVMASSGGTVTRAGWGSGYGYVVYIQHADGRETRYGHLSKVLVSVGQQVSQGQKIALSGNTGRSTGPHVHFEIRINGQAVNPLKYLN